MGPKAIKLSIKITINPTLGYKKVIERKARAIGRTTNARPAINPIFAVIHAQIPVVASKRKMYLGFFNRSAPYILSK